MEISDKASYLINLIEDAGYDAYAVGGCVRDRLMGRQCDDIDIATSATPEETERILAENGIKFIETGLKHGTITAVIDKDPFEITTFRTEGCYNDNRHPDKVSFVTDIKEDLSRRDFTINAIAYSNSKGIVDIFGGKDDIENKCIRAVGDANRRFNEDALRIMRAIRFSSVLGFEIADSTRKAIFENKLLLKNISVERIFTELSKLLLGDNVFSVLMEYREVIAVCIPEIRPMFDCSQNNPWHIYDVWEHTCKAVEACPKELKLRLTMLLHDVGKPQTKTIDERMTEHFKGHQAVSSIIAGQILKRFKVSNDIYEYATTIIPIHDIDLSSDKKILKRRINKLNQSGNGEYYIKELIKVRRADRLAQNPLRTKKELDELNDISNAVDDLIRLNEAVSVNALAINGFDLIALGIKGKEIGIMLNTLLEKVIDEELENDKAALIEYVKNTI